VTRRPNKRSDGVWIVVPAFNEAQAIASVLADLRRTGYQIVVVDDGSADATAELAMQAGATVVRHPVNLGQGAALQTGIKFALLQGANFIVTFDADGQHRVDEIATLLSALVLHRADFALGSRFLGRAANMPTSRRLLLQAAISFTRATTGLAITDAHNGLRAMTRRGAQTINLRQNRMAHASEILDQIAASGLKYVEVPITIEYSSYSLGKGQRSSAAVDILIDLYARALHQ
jgi:glycosyltransferase involved in cell wall biosynthesis